MRAKRLLPTNTKKFAATLAATGVLFVVASQVQATPIDDMAELEVFFVCPSPLCQNAWTMNQGTNGYAYSISQHRAGYDSADNANADASDQRERKDENSMKKAVERVSQQWAELYNEGDIAGLAELYTEDAVIYANTGEVVRGKDAIREAFTQAHDAAPGGVTREASEETEVFGDAAYTIGSYRVAGSDGETLSQGHYLTVLKKQAGDWKIHRQIDNLEPRTQTHG